MSDLISRSAVLEMFAKYKFGAINSDVEREYIKETIPLLVNSIPTVEAIPKEKLDEIVERLEEMKGDCVKVYSEYLDGEDLRRAMLLEEVQMVVKEVGGMNG